MLPTTCLRGFDRRELTTNSPDGTFTRLVSATRQVSRTRWVRTSLLLSLLLSQSKLLHLLLLLLLLLSSVQRQRKASPLRFGQPFPERLDWLFPRPWDEVKPPKGRKTAAAFSSLINKAPLSSVLFSSSPLPRTREGGWTQSPPPVVRPLIFLFLFLRPAAARGIDEEDGRIRILIRSKMHGHAWAWDNHGVGPQTQRRRRLQQTAVLHARSTSVGSCRSVHEARPDVEKGVLSGTGVGRFI
ncbi:hypothetical protein B0T10DRAFT_217690 [Thelonectria olida]|uniref:Uncharacterized protein n=1 Tax=Thelonectria olida TaxID=1576542 RepID=A0A9P9AQT0_9HYPO|nr:hypothetical protein B0T10DRAFT_217690 [Thelonectria olida]